MTTRKIHVIALFRNIVSTVNLGVKLDLKKIALHARNAEYNPKVGANAESFTYLV